MCQVDKLNFNNILQYQLNTTFMGFMEVLCLNTCILDLVTCNGCNKRSIVFCKRVAWIHNNGCHTKSLAKQSLCSLNAGQDQ